MYYVEQILSYGLDRIEVHKIKPTIHFQNSLNWMRISLRLLCPLTFFSKTDICAIVSLSWLSNSTILPTWRFFPFSNSCASSNSPSVWPNLFRNRLNLSERRVSIEAHRWHERFFGIFRWNCDIFELIPISKLKIQIYWILNPIIQTKFSLFG